MKQSDANVRFRNVIVDWNRVSDEGDPYCMTPSQSCIDRGLFDEELVDDVVEEISMCGKAGLQRLLELYASNFGSGCEEVFDGRAMSEDEKNGARVIFSILRRRELASEDAKDRVSRYLSTPDVYSLAPDELASAWIQWHEVVDSGLSGDDLKDANEIVRNLNETIEMINDGTLREEFWHGDLPSDAIPCINDLIGLDFFEEDWSQNAYVTALKKKVNEVIGMLLDAGLDWTLEDHEHKATKPLPKHVDPFPLPKGHEVVSHAVGAEDPLRLHITFGMALDGARWSVDGAAIGRITCGPKAMLQLLETRLGLTGRDISPAERVRWYEAKVRQANDAWYQASYNIDSWGVTTRLLEMRDELVMMGWKGESNPDSVRVSALARIESLVRNDPTSDEEFLGLADRLWAVAEAPSLGTEWAELTLVDDIALYPAVWQKILRNHFALQLAPQGDATSSTKPSLTIVTAPDEMRLAVAMARYLKAGSKDENGKTVVIAEGDTTLLDGVLARYGLPALGRSSSSVYREALEIIPLWIDNMWKPFSPKQLAGLLSMSFGPMSGYYAAKVIKALNEAPGIGGEAWKNAWEEEIPRAIDGAKEWEEGVKMETPCDEAKKEKLWARFKKLREIFETYRYSHEEGIPAGRALEVMQMVKDRFDDLRGRLQAERKWREGESGERMIALSVASEQARQLIETLSEKPADERITRPQMDRILVSIIGYGLGQYDVHEEVSDCRFVRKPGQVMEAVDTVLWWDFTDRTSVRRTAWLECEKKGLPGAADEGNRMRRELAAWNCPLKNARQNLVCFLPERKDGEAVVPHPFMDNLSCEYDGKEALKKLTKSCDSLVDEEDKVWTLAGRKMPMKEATPPERKLQATPGFVSADAQLRPEELSPTKIETLVSCPYKWYLQCHLKLRESAVNDMTSDPLVKGKLAHKVMEVLLSSGRDWTPDDAASEAGRLFEELTPQMAATFDVVERREDRASFKQEVCDAVRAFVGQMKRLNLKWKASEQDLPMSVAGGQCEGLVFKEKSKGEEEVMLSGIADLIACDKDDESRTTIVDFKMSKKEEKYKSAIQSGTAIQLAAYDWLLNRGSFKSKTAYYLLPKQLYLPCAQDGQKMWDLLEKTYDTIIKEMRAGKLAKGVPDKMFEGLEKRSGKAKREREHRVQHLRAIGRDPADFMDKAPDCSYCPYKAFCGEIEKCVPAMAAAEGGVE